MGHHRKGRRSRPRPRPRRVRIGDGRDRVRAAYTVPGPRDLHDVYPDAGLILRYGIEERVLGWLLFHVDE